VTALLSFDDRIRTDLHLVGFTDPVAV